MTTRIKQISIYAYLQSNNKMILFNQYAAHIDKEAEFMFLHIKYEN